MAEAKAQDPQTEPKAEEHKEMNPTTKSKTKSGFPFHFWKSKKENKKSTEENKNEEKMKEEASSASANKQESAAEQTAKPVQEEVKERKDSSSSSSSSSQDEKVNQQNEEEKKTFAEAVAGKQAAPTEEQPKLDIPEPETKKKSNSKGIFSIFHRKPSKEKETEKPKAATEATQGNQSSVTQPEMTENAIADQTEESVKAPTQENKEYKEEPAPEVKSAGVEGPEDGSESTRKVDEPKAVEETETKQAEDSEAKEIPKEVSEKQSGGFFHKFLRAFGCGGDITKETNAPRPQATTA